MKKWGGVVSSLCAGGFASWIIAKLLDFLWPQVFGFLVGQEVAIICCGVIGAGFGFLFGWKLRGSRDETTYETILKDFEYKLGMTVEGASEKLKTQQERIAELEPWLYEVESAIQRFDTLDKSQKSRVIECFKSEERGDRLKWPFEDPTNESLVDAGVFTNYKSKSEPDLTYYVLTREWRCIVRKYLETTKEEDEDSQDSFALRGEQAFDFIRSLPANQRKLLGKVYAKGGSLEANSSDVELGALASLGLLIRPAVFVPRTSVKWVLPSNINRIIRDYPAVLWDAMDHNPHDFSKLALQVWNLMEESDRQSLSVLRGASLHDGTKPKQPLILEMGGSLADLGIDCNRLKRLTTLGVLEKFPERALIPFQRTDSIKPLASGVSILGDSALLELADGIYETKGCTTVFCVSGDFASPPMQCVDLGLYGYTSVGQELIKAVETKRLPQLRRYLDRAYAKKRDADHPMTEWGPEAEEK